WDLTREQAPDLVVFYDGVNELWATELLRARDAEDVREPIDVFAEQARQGTLRGGTPAPDPPPGAAVVNPPKIVHHAPEFTARLAMNRYARSLEMSRATLGANGVPGAWFWQPS